MKKRRVDKRRQPKKPRRNPLLAAAAPCVACPPCGSKAVTDEPGVTRLFVISDATGNLARHMVSTYLTQFPPGSVDVRFEPFVKDTRRLADVLNRVDGGPGRAAVCHAVVSPELKQRIVDHCSGHRIPCHDLTGPGFAFLSEVIGVAPRPDLSALHPIDAAYRRRIDAVEFTLAHDDGLGLDSLADADVVLTGVSRTSKSPTCILLAQQGYRAANVPLAPGVEPPHQLLALPPGKVVGLYADAHQLAAIRHRRQVAWQTAIAGYGEDDAVEKEIAWSRRLFARRGWPALDVTDQAVEETAARVVQLLALRPRSSAGAAGGRSWDNLPAGPMGVTVPTASAEGHRHL